MIDVAEQFLMFGYAITGDPMEISALVAESHHPTLDYLVRWDHDAKWLEGIKVYEFGEYRTARPWAALPWLTEHYLRAHLAGVTKVAWPGL
jgi:hypothetical protein